MSQLERFKMEDFRVNKDKPMDSFVKERKYIGYTLGGEEVDPDSNSCYCRKDNQRFFIKQDTRGLFFNPIGLYSEGQENAYDKNRGKHVFSFKEVSSKCFNYYLMFLKTKNESYLLNAQREI